MGFVFMGREKRKRKEKVAEEDEDAGRTEIPVELYHAHDQLPLTVTFKRVGKLELNN